MLKPREKTKPRAGARTPSATPIEAPSVAVVVSRYNASVTSRLLDGAREELRRRTAGAAEPVVIEVPGAFELPVGVAAALETGRFDAVVALGCLIRGETSHDRVIADAVAEGLTTLSILAVRPVGFGLLTVDTAEQATARAGGEHGNKGAEAMGAVLDTLASLRALSGGGGVRLASRRDKAAAPRGGRG